MCDDFCRVGLSGYSNIDVTDDVWRPLLAPTEEIYKFVSIVVLKAELGNKFQSCAFDFLVIFDNDELKNT